MIKPREFWIYERKQTTSRKAYPHVRECTSDIAPLCGSPWLREKPFKAIELTPEVTRKLELFDEAVDVIRKYKEQVHMTGHGISPEESWAARTFLKKLGE